MLKMAELSDKPACALFILRRRGFDNPHAGVLPKHALYNAQPTTDN
jgi:hypothetical protein